MQMQERLEQVPALMFLDYYKPTCTDNRKTNSHMDDHVNPHLPRVSLLGDMSAYVGFVSPILPQLVGNCNFQECKSPLSPTSARTWGNGALH